MNLWQDIRYGARALRTSPGFAVTAVLTMALGIGVTTAIFSVCDAMLWKPVPLPRLDTLVTVVGRADDPADYNSTAAPDVEDIRNASSSFESFASWMGGLANIAAPGGQPERVEQSLVNANFFDVVGVQPARGRAFQPGDDQPGREREVILSDGFWRRRFAGDPNVVGRTIRLDDQTYTITGIMPASFDFPLATEIWTPLALTPAQRNDRRSTGLFSIARLKQGRNVAEAGSEMDAIAARLAKQYPLSNKNRRFAVWPAIQFIVDYETRHYLIMMLGSVLFVLLIACANVANLQFARATGRLREIAVRRALGAGRWRICTQLVTESVLLSFTGAVLGLVVAGWGIHMMQVGMPPEVERYVLGFRDMQLDSRALLFTLAAAVAAGVIAGLAPAWQSSQPNLSSTLRDGGRGASQGRGRQRLRNVLVGGEVALAVVLLIGASLMVRGFRAIVASGTALEPSTLLSMRLAVTENKYRDKHQAAEYYREVLERVSAVPGVKSVTAISSLPYSMHSNSKYFTIEGRTFEAGQEPIAMYQPTSANFFETLHVPLRQGRFLQESDGADAPPVAVISERLAQRWWSNESPLGRHIRTDAKSPWMTIVGVVGDIPHNPYERAPRRTLYVPYQQAPVLWMDVGVRTARDPLALAPAITGAIRSIDAEQPITEMRTMEKAIHNSAIGLNYVAALMGIFGGIALLLSAIGVYGVMAYSVSEQTHDIGVRMALGAPQTSVLRAILRRGLVVTCAGLVVGLPIAYLFSRMMASQVFGVTTGDPASFIGIPLTLLATASLAVYIPARRAMKIDPIIALRYE